MFLSDIIGYILLLPVTVQIILPLVMLVTWIVWRGVNTILGKKNIA